MLDITLIIIILIYTIFGDTIKSYLNGFFLVKK